MGEFDDRRSYPRVGFKVPAHVRVGPEQVLYRGYVMNLSEGGLLVMVDAGVQMGPELQMTFEIPPSMTCAATGRIAHTMDMGKFVGLGIELTDTNDAYVNFLRNLAAASPAEIMFFIKDIKRIYIDVP